MVTKINVDKDIRLAETLPAKFYKDENLFDIIKEKNLFKILALDWR